MNRSACPPPLLPPRWRNGLKLLGAALLTGACLFFGIKLALLLLPVTLGFLFSQLAEPFVRFLKKHGVPRSIGAFLGLILLLAVVGTLLTLLAARIVSEISSLIENWPQLSAALYEWIDGTSAALERWSTFLHPRLSALMQQLYGAAMALAANAVSALASFVVTCAVGLPGGIVFLIVLLLSTFFFLRDRDSIAACFRRHLPARCLSQADNLRKELFGALFGYLRAQLILMGITFLELLTAFLLFKLDYAALLAAVIAIVDALPIFGAGLFLLPAAAYGFLSGNLAFGVRFAILYLIVLSVRQTIEPRIVGKQLGLHPLLTLSAMYGGLRLCGIAGLLLGPVALLIVRNLWNAYRKGRTLRELLDGVGEDACEQPEAP